MLLLPLLKLCSKCKINKPYIDFFKHKSQKYGIGCQCKLCNKQYNIKNADKINQYGKQHRIDNPKYYREYDKEYCQTPQGKLGKRVREHKRRTLKLQNTILGKHHTTADIILKLKLQHDKCIYCKTSIKEGYHIDHIIPLSKNGSNEASNIQLLCIRCNRTKYDKLPHEFAQEKGMLF